MTRDEDALIIDLPASAPDTVNTVVVLDVEGKADVSNPPKIDTELAIFIDTIAVPVTSDRENVEIRYTLDGTVPSINSQLIKGMIHLKETATISARCFRDGKPVSSITQATFSKVTPKLPVKVKNLSNGINYAYYEGDWDSLPNFRLLNPLKEGTLQNFDFSPRKEVEHFGFEYTGFIKVSIDGVYTFFTASDDGSQLYIGDELVVDNDQLHGTMERKGVIALATGLHPIRVTFFEKTGGDELKVLYEGPRIEKQVVQDSVLFK
jgi:hypothetical protein